MAGAIETCRELTRLAADERDDDNLQSVARSLDRTESMIDDLMPRARGGELRPEHVVLADIVRTCWRKVEQCRLESDVDPDTTVRADPNRPRLLFGDLI